MRHIFTLAILSCVLSACQSGPSQYLLNMQRYQGASEAQLIDALGPPDNQYEVQGVKYLSYSHVSQYYSPPDVGYGFGTGFHPSGSAMWFDQRFGNNPVIVNRCDVYFAVRNHRVEKMGYRGNAC